MKASFNEDIFNVMFNKGILANTKKTIKKYTDKTEATAFTFQEDSVFVSPMGKLYLWKGDYIAVKGL
jgi:hypothetical protein